MKNFWRNAFVVVVLVMLALLAIIVARFGWADSMVFPLEIGVCTMVIGGCLIDWTPRGTA